MSPLAGVALLAMRGRWLVGLVNGAGARGTAAAPHLSGTAAVPHLSGAAAVPHLSGTAAVVQHLSGTVAAAPAWTAGLLHAGASTVSQFFVWVYVILGVLIGITVFSAAVDWVVGEIKLRREYTRPLPPSAASPPDR
jgi:hypothetical protein